MVTNLRDLEISNCSIISTEFIIKLLDTTQLLSSIFITDCEKIDAKIIQNRLIELKIWKFNVN